MCLWSTRTRMFPQFSRNFLFNSNCWNYPTLIFPQEREKLKVLQVLPKGLDLATEFHFLGLQYPTDLQVSLELMIPLVHKDHIYQDHKVHLLQILQQHQMAISLLYLLMEIFQMEILHHHLPAVVEVLLILVVVLQILMGIPMGLQAQVEIPLLLHHLPVGEEEVVVHLHPLLRTKADQMGHKVQIFPLSIIEAELQIPEQLHKS